MSLPLYLFGLAIGSTLLIAIIDLKNNENALEVQRLLAFIRSLQNECVRLLT